MADAEIVGCEILFPVDTSVVIDGGFTFQPQTGDGKSVNCTWNHF